MNRQQRRAQKKTPEIPEQEADPQLMKVAQEAENTGCAQCGNRFAQGLPYFVVEENNTLTARCPRCMANSPEGTRVKYAAIFLGGAPDPWIADDRDFFKSRPKRHYRLRDFLPGELDAMILESPDQQRQDTNIFLQNCQTEQKRPGVLVYQLKEGRRVRIPMGISGNDPFQSWTDAGIKRMFPNIDQITQPYRDMNDQNEDDIHLRQMKHRIDRSKDLMESLGIPMNQTPTPNISA